MEGRQRQRRVYINTRQKKKLFELINKHPELLSFKVTQKFGHKDSQRLWQNITSELNSMSGGKKTWRQWKKTWQDIRCKSKKRRAENIEPLLSSLMHPPAEQEAHGIINEASSTANDMPQESTIFIPLEQDDFQEINDDIESAVSLSEPESPPEVEAFTGKMSQLKDNSNTKVSSKHPNNGYINFDTLTVQEQKKIQLKEDYINFKKDYLRQKLKFMKEQTEALKSIAKELSK